MKNKKVIRHIFIILILSLTILLSYYNWQISSEKRSVNNFKVVGYYS